ncbi:MAG: TRAP transporter small permease [Desulfofustis sp. PB-SRB1]|jgi:C4-dicarboxylate transporter DctQ subunit|nr:TRAP transporter small permease [Desulfofustis sp. PB-SRB1]MBM1001921.1 TRAP transporter small permease [Desulfofustis sp. PB-SRB1]HBH27746.1 TRAP transporter small permease [Desulfofustis sp.]HBH31337.1 TRAP transporter small permease [Desulfofustis sp.]
MTFKKILKLIDQNGERYLLLPLYAMVVSTIFMEVVRRSVLSYSSIWAEEIARYAFIYIAWIGASAAIKERAHIRIDILLHVFPQRMKAIVFLFGDVITLILAVLVIYMSMEPVIISIEYGSVTHGLRVSQAFFLAAVPLGFTMMVFRLLQSIKRDWSDMRAGRPVFEGNKLFD